jgi:ArsR family transcriptional regulator
MTGVGENIHNRAWVVEMTQTDGTAEFLKALAHPARLEIATLLCGGEACICHLEAHLGFRQPYISQQVMVLRKAGLVAERREGTYVYYRLVDPRVFPLLALLTQEGKGPRRAKASRRVACPCPSCSPAGGRDADPA